MMWVLATHPERIGGLAAALARVLPASCPIESGSLASTFSSGFAAARSRVSSVLAVLWSFPLWLLIAAEAWTVTIAFGIAMPFPGTFLLQALLVIGVAVPTPGGVGSFHEAYRIGVTTFFGAPNDQAVAAAIVTHAISFIPPVCWAASCSWLRTASASAVSRTWPSSARDKEGPAADEVPVLRLISAIRSSTRARARKARSSAGGASASTAAAASPATSGSTRSRTW